MRPHLSIVVTSRNDDHGGEMLGRMRLFVLGLLEQTRRYRFPIELVVVEWNPPPDRPPLRQVLPLPGAGDCARLRFIVVPGEIHERYRRAPEIQLFQMIAKNVGIRRSRGAFVLCTNVDLLFSDPLFRALADGDLEADTFYRANRCDVPVGIEPGWALDEQLAWCERHVVRRLGFDGDTAVAGTAVTDLAQLDTDGCGDFTLMSRQAWFAIQGHVELDLYSLHVDTLALVAAAALGYRQRVFPPLACTYHVEHATGWQPMSPVERMRFLEARPSIDYPLLREVADYALERRQPLGLNSDDWGLADLELEEHEFAPSPRQAGDAARQAASGPVGGSG